MRVRLAVTVAAVGHRKGAVRLHRDLDPVCRAVRGCVGAIKGAPSIGSLAARLVSLGASRPYGRGQNIGNDCGIVDVRNEYSRAVVFDAGRVSPMKLPDILDAGR